MRSLPAMVPLATALLLACGGGEGSPETVPSAASLQDAHGSDLTYADVRLPNDASDTGLAGDADIGLLADGEVAKCVVDQDCPSQGMGCLVSVCHPDLGCLLTPRADNTACDDGNPCTNGGICKQGVCRFGVPVNCDDANPCTFDWCREQDGECLHTNSIKGSACVHSDPCVVAASCSQGKCVSAGPSWCDCSQDKHCKPYEDGDLCNGTLFCDKKSFPWRCHLEPGTIIKCDASSDTACVKATCEAKTGLCTAQPAEDGTKCDDADPCTSQDSCQAGVCTSGANSCGD